jgi:hypothetical protein
VRAVLLVSLACLATGCAAIVGADFDRPGTTPDAGAPPPPSAPDADAALAPRACVACGESTTILPANDGGIDAPPPDAPDVPDASDAACTPRTTTEVSLGPSIGPTTEWVIDADYGDMYAVGFTVKHADEKIVAVHPMLVRGDYTDGKVYAEVRAGTPKNDGGPLGPAAMLPWAQVGIDDTRVTLAFAQPIATPGVGSKVWIRFFTDAPYDDGDAIVVDAYTSTPSPDVTLWEGSDGAWQPMTRNLVVDVDVAFCP